MLVVGLAGSNATSGAAPELGTSKGRGSPAAVSTIAGVSGHLWFEPNVGQADPEARFILRAGSCRVLFTTNGVVVAIPEEVAGRRGPAQAPLAPDDPAAAPDAGSDRQRVSWELARMRFAGANPGSEPVGEHELPGKVNVIEGRDPSRWRGGVPAYAAVRYSNLYPGIDAVFYDRDGRLELGLAVEPGADPSGVALDFGAGSAPRLEANGDISLAFRAGRLRLGAPTGNQALAGGAPPQRGRYELRSSSTVGFSIPPQDRGNALLTGPTIVFATYLGGNLNEDLGGVAVDGDGNVVVAGTTWSTNFPLQAPIHGALLGESDLFVTKLSADGGSLLWSTYLGGNEIDAASLAGLDQDGNVLLVGFTRSSDFPVTGNAFQSQLRGERDALVAKIHASGFPLLYATYFGGSDREVATGHGADKLGNVSFTGWTYSRDLPTRNPLQSAPGTHAGSETAYVAKIDTTSGNLEYATYLGGSGLDEGNDLVLDPSGNALVVGWTASADFPTRGALQPALAPSTDCGGRDAFLAKLDPDGRELVYSTYLGGTGDEQATAVAVDTQGNAYVVGATSSPDFPVVNPVQAHRAGLQSSSDAFATKVSATGSTILFSTYLGGSACGSFPDPSDECPCVGSEDSPAAAAVDGGGRLYVAGVTGSPDFPVANGETFHGGGDAYLFALGPSGSDLLYSTLIGGSGHDGARAVAVDRHGAVYVAGNTASPDFPTRDPVQASLAGWNDAFIVKVNPLPLAMAPSASPTSGPWPLQVHLFSHASGGAPPYTYDWALGDGLHNHDADPVITYYGAGTYHVTLTVTDSDGAAATGSLDITALPTCQLGCSAEAPDRVLLGSPASFAAHTETTECTGPVSLLWDLGDGSPSSAEASFTHTYPAGGAYTWHMTATSDGKTCEMSRMITVDDISCSGPYDLFIPAAAHTPGVNGTAWQTDLDLLYLGLLEAHVDLALLKAGQANLTPQIASVIVPSGRALRLADVLGTLLPASNAALGVRFCGGTPLVNARFYTTTCNAGGTCGMYIPGVGADRAVTHSRHGVFHHLSYSTDSLTGFRVNIGFVSAVGFAVQVVVRLYGDDGSLLGTLTRALQPYEHLQLTRVHALAGTPAVASGWATVEVTTPDGEVHSYAMSIDNRSGDAIYMPPELVSQ